MHTNFGGCDLSGFGDTATFKNSQISLSDHGPWPSKNSMNRNQLKKFMQVGIDVRCMHTNFGGCDLSGFGDTATFKNGQISFLTMDYSPWSSKNPTDRNQFKKFMQVGIDVKCMHTNFGGCDLYGFGDTATFKNGQISVSDHGLQSMVIKKFNQSESAQKINAMSSARTPILVSVTSSVSEILLSSKRPNFPF